jgi:hypothetical protein
LAQPEAAAPTPAAAQNKQKPGARRVQKFNGYQLKDHFEVLQLLHAKPPPSPSTNQIRTGPDPEISNDILSPDAVLTFSADAAAPSTAWIFSEYSAKRCLEISFIISAYPQYFTAFNDQFNSFNIAIIA